MREINAAEITAAVEKLCIKAATVLTDDMARAIERAYETEKGAADDELL